MFDFGIRLPPRYDLTRVSTRKPLTGRAADPKSNTAQRGVALRIEISSRQWIATGDADGGIRRNHQDGRVVLRPLQKDQLQPPRPVVAPPMCEPALVGTAKSDRLQLLGEPLPRVRICIQVYVAVRSCPATHEEVDSDAAKEPDRLTQPRIQ